MKLANFLNNLFKEDGFILIDANSKKYIIGNPKKKKPIILRLLDKKLHYKLLFYPDLYFGEAYTDGTAKIENGSFDSGDAEFLFNFVRHIKPKKIIEVGCGTSTKIIQSAILFNEKEKNISLPNIFFFIINYSFISIEQSWAIRLYLCPLLLPFQHREYEIDSFYSVRQ